jgi:IS4 transposase
LVGAWAEQAAQESEVIQRQRKFSAVTLSRCFVFGFLSRPNASDEDLAQMAGACGVEVTPQAVEQRYTPQLVAFLEALFRRAIQCVVSSEESLAPLLERFGKVLVLDSTTISLPAEMSSRFPGCGGSYGSGQAAMKLQVEWDLCRGAFQAMAIEPGRDCDYKTSLQQTPLPPGSLRIADLGYFDTKVFQQYSRDGVFWLSRLQFGTSVFPADERTLTNNYKPRQLLKWLAEQSKSIIDQPIRLGTELQVPCRLLAWRVPTEVADRRRQKLIVEARRKSGRTPSAERLAWCDWTILVTNVPADQLTPLEAAVLYRARWQVELLFKRWKSQGLVAQLSGATVERQLVRLWSRLLAVLIQHWLVLTSVWGDPRHSLMKASEGIRRYATMLAATVPSTRQFTDILALLRRTIRVTARQNKRRYPSTFQLLNDPTLLDYSLT